MIEMTTQTALLLASSTGVGVLMMRAGIEKKMLEWKRQARNCAGCGKPLPGQSVCSCSRS
jgi:NADH pyrophosphatase NudC (nudix superfamily)